MQGNISVLGPDVLGMTIYVMSIGVITMAPKEILPNAESNVPMILTVVHLNGLIITVAGGELEFVKISRTLRSIMPDL